MNGHVANGAGRPKSSEFDVVIVGAGISGINAAYRLQTTLPDYTYTILEGRNDLGGTWDLFKYPGIRSDSDLYTFGFPFNPWSKPNPIATGESIKEYMWATARKFAIDRHFDFGNQVRTANWSSEEQRWILEVAKGDNRRVVRAKFVILGTGYYDYDTPLQADIPGLENFKGKTVHPQFWDTSLDWTNKKIIVIGSGATAITLVPGLVEKAAKVTMLQRSPSYILSLPQRKPTDPKTWTEWLFPKWFALKLTRWYFLCQSHLFYLFTRRFPNAGKKLLMGEAQKQLPKGFPMDPHFNPRYNVWDQRLCLCPDGDFFQAFHTGKADVVTAIIKNVVEDGIELENGDKLDADIIITATGLNVQFGGKIDISVDNEPVELPTRFLWRNTMLTGVPNMGFVIGYTNMPWTLGADAAARLTMRLLTYLRDNNYTSAVAEISEKDAMKSGPALNLTSTYITKALHKIPRATGTAPWKPRDSYLRDSWDANHADLRQGLVFKSVST